MWFFVFAVVIATIATTSITALHSQTQTECLIANSPTPTPPSKTREQIRTELESQFPVADYDAQESSNLQEREIRKAKNSRYDKYRLVVKTPRPLDAGSTLFDEVEIPPTPVVESEIVISGEILGAEAYLSNTKTGIYSEFPVRVEQIIKNSDSRKVAEDEKITIDRPGGFVRYPSGQKLLYGVSGKWLPRVGKQYVLFLTKSDQSPNYRILTGYELKEGKIYPLDDGYQFEDFKGIEITNFIKTIREMMLKISPKVENE
jgi:hypothetical protein